jgi:hypothetical protein
MIVSFIVPDVNPTIIDNIWFIIPCHHFDLGCQQRLLLDLDPINDRFKRGSQ